MQGTGKIGDEYGALLITPPGVAGSRAHRAVDFLADAGFAVVAATRLEVEAGMVRALWSSQLADFGEERVGIMARLFGLGPSVLLIARSVDGHPGGPVPDALKRLQGPSSPRKLQPWHLRHRMGACNKLNNLVHVPNDATDVVREVRALLGSEAHQRLSATWHRLQPMRDAALRPILAPGPREEVICPVTRCVDLLERLIVGRCDAVALRPSLVGRVEAAVAQWRGVLSAVTEASSMARRAALGIDPERRLVPAPSGGPDARRVLSVAAAAEACLATGIAPDLAVLEGAAARREISEWDYVILATETHATLLECARNEMRVGERTA